MVDSIMGELERLPVDDETWGAKAKVMIENLRHHIEEEEGEMFPTARRASRPTSCRSSASGWPRGGRAPQRERDGSRDGRGHGPH